MAGRALAPGEHGEITVSPQRKDTDGKWKTCTARQAQRWRAQCYLRDHQGVRKPLSRIGETSGKARTILELALKEELNPDKGGSIHITVSTPFTDAVAHWMTQVEREGSHLSPRSLVNYKRVVDKHINNPGPELKKALTENNAHIRDARLDAVNDVQRLTRYLQAVADTHGTATGMVARAIVANVLNLAVQYGTLPASAMRNVPQVKAKNKARRGNGERDTRRAFTREERDALVDYADSLANPTGPYNPRAVRRWQTTADLIAFMSRTGCRVSEARRLEWTAVDEGCVGATVIGKGHRGKPRPRHVDFPPSLVKRMLRRQEMSGGRGFVFSSPGYNDPEREWDQAHCASALSEVIAGAGFPWATPHSLRRTVATLASKAGAPLEDIADQLGHMDPSMTARVYLGRNWMGERRSVADLLD
jgi:integrase